MGKFIKISAIKYKRQRYDRNNPNEVDLEEDYDIILNSDFIHNIREIKFLDSKNRSYMRYQVSTIANNSISGHYISKEHFDLLVTTIASDPDFGLIVIE